MARYAQRMQIIIESSLLFHCCVGWFGKDSLRCFVEPHLKTLTIECFDFVRKRFIRFFQNRFALHQHWAGFQSFKLRKRKVEKVHNYETGVAEIVASGHIHQTSSASLHIHTTPPHPLTLLISYMRYGNKLLWQLPLEAYLSRLEGRVISMLTLWCVYDWLSSWMRWNDLCLQRVYERLGSLSA